MGVSLCGVQAAAMAYLSEEMPPEAFGKAVGLFISGGALGGMFGRVVVSLVTDYFGWREATLLMAVLGIVSSLYFVRTLPKSQNFHPSAAGLKRLSRGFAAIMSDTVFTQLFAIGFLTMGGFVTTYNYITYRLIEPPFSLSKSVIGSIFLIYFTGMFGAAWAGNRASIVSHQNLLWKMIAVVILGLLVTLSGRLECVILGLILFTFGFFSTHSVASGWVSQRARDDRALAASLYLFAYYQGSALVGTSGGYAWQEGGWPFVVSVTGAVSFFGLLLALNLRRYVEKR
jgi:YNFM family putative membrane transporter